MPATAGDCVVVVTYMSFVGFQIVCGVFMFSLALLLALLLLCVRHCVQCLFHLVPWYVIVAYPGDIYYVLVIQKTCADPEGVG